jgi:outer membrane usher protein FimD/PapC
MPTLNPVSITAKVARKQPDLPRFVVIPSSAVAEWGLTGTTPVDVTINGVAVERRNIKFWDAAKWFFSITVKDCKKVGIDTGDTVELVISPVGSL